MLPKHHIIAGAMASLLIYLISPVTITQTIIIFISSFIIDLDHYLYHIFKKRDFNFFNARKWFLKKRKIYMKLSVQERNKYKGYILIFHGIEFWILLLILSLFNKIFLFMLLGISIHMFLDYLEIFYLKEPLYSKFSQIMVFFKNKNKESLIIPGFS